MRIHVSKECNDALKSLGGYNLEQRGHVELKGKGKMFYLEFGGPWVRISVDACEFLLSIQIRVNGMVKWPPQCCILYSHISTRGAMALFLVVISRSVISGIVGRRINICYHIFMSSLVL